MKRITVCSLLAFVVGVVLMAATSGAMSGERLPHIYRATETIVVNLATGTAEYSGHGEATHTGRFTNQGTGTVDQNMNFHAEGTLTASNGDQIFWEGSGVLGGTMMIVLDGGTGRFENVHGELPTWETYNLVQVIDGDLLTLTFESRATGWISY